MRYTIQNITPWSAMKIGGVVGGVLGFFPGFTLGMTIRSLVHTLRVWLESWLRLDIPLVGSYSLLDAVNLGDFLSRLQCWDDRSWLLVLFLLLLSMVLGGVVGSLLSGLAALIYNLVASVSGGLVVQAEALREVGRAAEFPVKERAGGENNRSLTTPSVTTPAPPASPEGSGGGWLIAQPTQQRWSISQGETRIGSGPGNQIVLGGLAANHAAIRWENGRFILYDYSGGQTWVNGRSLVGPNMLKSGFQIRFGNQEFLFQI